MAEYWSREEKVEAIQYVEGDKGLDALLIWSLDRYSEGFFVWVEGHSGGRSLSSGNGWNWNIDVGMAESDGEEPVEKVRLQDGDYLVIDGLGEFSVMGEREFAKRYYRRYL